MSDSEKNELDSYGVWVKKPPRSADSGDEQTQETAESPDFDIDFGTTQQNSPDAGDDDPEDSSLSTDELAALTNTLDITEEPGDPAAPEGNSDSMEEISLDEFGFTDESDDEEDAQPQESADDNGTAAEGSEITITDNTEGIADNDTMDINLTFDDGQPEPEQPKDDEAGTENIDLSEFGFSDSDEGAGDTSDVDVTDMFMDDESAEKAVEQDIEESASGETARSEDGTEDVDLSEFGFSDSDEGLDDSSSETEPGSGTMSVTADDDDFDDPVIADSDGDEETDDTFDVDSIMNSVEDEDGNTVSINDNAQEEAGAKDSAASGTEPEAETEQDDDEIVIRDDDDSQFSIPDTFDEETASLMNDDEKAEEEPSKEDAVEDTETDSGTQSASEKAESTKTDAILSQIMSQLTSLKDDITNLRQDVEKIKKAPAEKSEAETETEEKSDEAETQSQGGFFSDSDSDDDDTIALSLDELDNILNTTDVTESEDEETAEEETAKNEPPIEDDTLESVLNESEENAGETVPEESESENSEEPALDDIAETALDGESEGAKVDDILVEGSGSSEFSDIIGSDDEMDEDINLDNFSFDDPIEDDEPLPEGELELPADEDDATSGERLIEEPASEETFGEDVSEGDGGIVEEPADTETFGEDDSFNYNEVEPTIEESLTESNMDYLASDPALSENGETGGDKDSEEKSESIPGDLKTEIKSVLSYMDQLLENLPEEKIAEFAQSEQFETYKKLFKELGLA